MLIDDLLEKNRKKKKKKKLSLARAIEG